jgi:hypothetical protein
MLIASAPIIGHGRFFEEAAAGFSFLD